MSIVPAVAQVVPNGNHYGARTSDTGFSGAVSTQGECGQSVALDLPAVRGGLPVPVQIINGASRFGAAGLGWDVPLSFIRSHECEPRKGQLDPTGIGLGLVCQQCGR